MRFHCVNTFSNEESQSATVEAKVGTSVPSAPQLSAPKFGQWLAEQRGDRSYEAIAVKVRKHVEGMGLKVNRSAIKKYEDGRIPPWPILYAFAVIYDAAPTDVAARLFTAIQLSTGRDLLRHSRDQQSGSLQGGSADDPASARRIAQLESELATLKTQWGDVQDVARALFRLTAPDEGQIAPRAAARRSRTNRKTG